MKNEIVRKMKKQMNMKKIILLIALAIVIIGMAGSQTAEAQTERRFGFGFVGVGGLIVNGYTADQFFNGMFLTPPYPSTVHLMITAQSNDFVQTGIRDYISRLMERSAAYPNIKLGIHVAFDVRNEQRWTEFTSFLDFLRARPDGDTIGFIGFAQEQLGAVTAWPYDYSPAYDRTKSLIESRGWQFINYYPQGYMGSKPYTNYLWLTHTNYPNGDNEAILDRIGTEIVGITHGTDGGTIFPSPWCTPGATPWWNLVFFPEGYAPPERDANSAPCDNVVPLRSGFQPSIRYALERDGITNPAINRQWNYFIAGRAATSHSDRAMGVSFTGVSGKTDAQALWDNPTFRNEINNWLLENPSIFLQGALPIKQAEYGPADFMDDVGIPTYGIGLWGAGSNFLRNQDDAFFENYILPLGIKLVYGMDVGWYGGRAQTSISTLPYSSTIDNFLSRTDKYGILVTFNSPLKDYGDWFWSDDVAKAYPELITYNYSGEPPSKYGYIQYIRIDHPLVAQQLFNDLKKLYEYYGEHISWMGFGSVVATDGDGYTGNIRGFAGQQWSVHQMNNETFLNYTKSRFYLPHANERLTDPTATLEEKYNDILQYHDAGGFGCSGYSGENKFGCFIGDQQDAALQEARRLFEQYTGRQWLVTTSWRSTTPIYAKPPSPRLINGIMFTYDGVGATTGALLGDTEMDWKGYMTTAGSWTMRVSPRESFVWNSLSHDNDYPRDLTPLQIGKQFILEVPFTSGSTFHTFDAVYNDGPNGIMNLTEQSYSRSFGEILNRMKYVGGWYGEEKKEIKVLALISGGAANSIQYLTPSLDITVVIGNTDDGNLTRFGDLTQFDVILIGLGGGGSEFPLTADARNSIVNFVQNGGGLVVASGWGYSDWLNDVMGYDQISGSIPSPLTVALPNHPILKPYGSSILSGGFRFYTSGSITFSRISSNAGDLVAGSDSTPVMFYNTYGNGRSVFVPSAVSNPSKIGSSYPPDLASKYNGAPRDSWMVLVNNAIFWAARKENLIPAWWYNEYKSGGQVLPWNEETFYSVDGRPGDPILVWFTNNGAANDIELHLNRNFYGISNNWLQLDVTNMQIISQRSSDDITVRTNVPSQTWKPIYILNQVPDYQSLYSTGFVLNQTFGGNKATLSVKGTQSQTVFNLVKSPNKPQQVTANGTRVLPEVSSLNDLAQLRGVNWFAEQNEGWFYDNLNQILYIKFKSQ